MPTAVYRRALAVTATITLALGGVLVTAMPANAAHPISVTLSTGGVGDAGSLPWAIAEANGDPGSTITFDPSLSLITVPVTDLLVIEESVTITGPGESVLTIDAPGIVFEITPVTPVIDVTISGLTLEDSTAVGDCGIDAVDVNLTIFDLTANGFGCSGVSVADGSLVATDVTTNDNVGSGIAFFGDEPSESMTLTRVVANGNGFTGINAEATDAVSSITDAQVDGNLFGIYTITRGGSLAISNARVDGSGGLGIGLALSDGAVATITGSSATASPGQGFLLGADGGSRLTASHLTATGNEAGGIEIGASDGSTVELQASLAEGNGDPCGCATAGGILVDAYESTVVISGTHVLGNFATNGAGVYVRSSYGVSGLLTIVDSVVSGNEASANGGGIYVEDLGVGSVTGTLSIVRTTVSGNTALLGGGVAIGGFSHAAPGTPLVLIDSSTLSGNTASLAGGGGFAQKLGDTGGLGLIRIVNTTVSGNSAGVETSGFATLSNTGSSGEMATEILHSTIASNTDQAGLSVEGNQTVLLSHLLSADNDVNDLEQFLTDPLDLTIDFSLIENPDPSVTVPASGNIVGVDPALGPLKNNGGTTFTHLVSPGSAAYNAGNPAITGAPAYDQRGLARIYQKIDIGAVEWHPELAVTGSTTEPEPGLVGLLFLFVGVALVAASRRFAL